MILNMTKQFYFISGLPRSGSTLLAALLSQNPDLYVSMTSPLIGFLGTLESTWIKTYKQFTCPFDNHLENLSKGLINNFYESVDKKFIIDKSRDWSSNIGHLHQLFGEQPKLICTVRDIPSIISSFYKLICNDVDGKRNLDHELQTRGKNLNDSNRCQQIWESFVKESWNSLKEGYQAYPECVHIIEYDDIIENPSETIEGVYDFLSVPRYQHRFENIETIEIENDEKWGLKDLHKVAPQLKRQSLGPESILGKEIYRTYLDLKLEFWR